MFPVELLEIEEEVGEISKQAKGTIDEDHDYESTTTLLTTTTTQKSSTAEVEIVAKHGFVPYDTFVDEDDNDYEESGAAELDSSREGDEMYIGRPEDQSEETSIRFKEPGAHPNDPKAGNEDAWENNEGEILQVETFGKNALSYAIELQVL